MSVVQTPVRPVALRWLGVLVGLAVTSWALNLDDEIGSVFLLISPIMGIALLGAVLAGELLTRAPAPGPARRAVLETRRVADYLPPSARVVGALLGVYGLVSLVAATPAAGGVVDQTCADGYGSYGRWPAPLAVILPPLAVVLVGLTVAAVALRRLVDRPRPAGVPVDTDDEARRATAAAVVAACAVLVTGPLCVMSAGLGTDLMTGCGALDPVAGFVLLWLAGTAVLVAGWALLVLLAPRRRGRA